MNHTPQGGEIVPRAELSSIKMTAGNERRFTEIVDGGKVKMWIGFGWVDMRDAGDADLVALPIAAVV